MYFGRSPTFHFFLLAVLLPVGLAVQCTDMKALLADAVLPSPQFLTSAINYVVPKTVGHCDGVDDSLMPCKDVASFPIKKYVALGVYGGSNYLTHLDTFHVDRFYVKCGGEGKHHWFLDIEATLGELAVDVFVEQSMTGKTEYKCITGTDDCLFRADNVKVEVAARLRCYNSTHVRISLDDEDGFSFGGKIKVHTSLHDFDLTNKIRDAVYTQLQTAIIPCPGLISSKYSVCGAVCAGTPNPEGLAMTNSGLPPVTYHVVGFAVVASTWTLVAFVLYRKFRVFAFQPDTPDYIALDS